MIKSAPENSLPTIFSVKALLTNEQWDLVHTITFEGKNMGCRPVVGSLLRYWLRAQKYNIIHSKSKLKWEVKQYIFDSAVLPMVIAQVDDKTIRLGFAICEDAYISGILRQQGIVVMTWADALKAWRNQGVSVLMSDALKAIQSEEATGTHIHQEEQSVNLQMSRALGLGWQEEAHRGVDSETVCIIKRYLADRHHKYSILREVALSSLIHCEDPDSLSYDERRMLTTSSLDFVVYGLPPLNRPLLAIEYDGHLHRSNSGKIHNDSVKNKILNKARLPLLRINTNEARAIPFDKKSIPEDANRRLTAILSIASVMTEKAVVDEKLSKQESAAFIERFLQWDEFAYGMYSKRFELLDQVSQSQIMHLSRDYIQDAEWLADAQEADCEEASKSTLEGQLHAHNVRTSLVTDFEILEGPLGKRGRAVLTLPNGSLPIVLETVDIVLSAPGIDANIIDRLVLNQIYLEIAQQASQYVQ